MSASFDILYEDNHLLAINKPAGLATMGVAAGVPSVLEQARQYLNLKAGKPGNVYLGIVSRLDAPVTGVLLLARTSKAASRLTVQFRERQVEKVYQVLVQGSVESASGELQDYVRKDERHRKMHVTGENTPGAKRAILSYRTIQVLDDLTHLEVQLQTGRKHQIRLQFGSRSHPVLGDRKYGATKTFPSGIALHAHRLALTHPVRQSPLELTAPFPGAWGKIGITLS
ncbi:MAG: RluA family pseudouridine synthase [Planctomycetales bacterium]